MTRDATHMEQVERWARYVRDNPDSWKKQHTEFINALYDKQQQVYERILAQPGGKEKLERLRNARN